MEDIGDRPGAQRGAIHDGGIELVRLVRRVDRAMPCVKEGTVLEPDDRHGHRIDRGTAARQHRLGRRQNALQGGMVRALALGGRGSQGNCTRAPVNDDNRFHLGSFAGLVDRHASPTTTARSKGQRIS